MQQMFKIVTKKKPLQLQETSNWKELRINWVSTRVQSSTHSTESQLLCEVSAESDSNDSVWRLTPTETEALLLNGKERGMFEKYLLVKLGNNGAACTV